VEGSCEHGDEPSGSLKLLGIFEMAAQLAAPQEWLSPVRIFFYYYYLVCEAVCTAATPGLLCQPRIIMKMIVEKQMECRLAGETEVLGENLPQRHFCPSQNPT
jgi:hypothetical protein